MVGGATSQLKDSSTSIAWSMENHRKAPSAMTRLLIGSWGGCKFIFSEFDAEHKNDLIYEIWGFFLEVVGSILSFVVWGFTPQRKNSGTSPRQTQWTEPCPGILSYSLILSLRCKTPQVQSLDAALRDSGDPLANSGDPLAKEGNSALAEPENGF